YQHAGEQIRVQAAVLDNLVNFAGEVSIYHSRLNEQMGQYRFNLNEFDQTVSRLRGQLRTMEDETESQILYRNQVRLDASDGAPDENVDFDPLEFDRYTRLQELSRSLSESIGDLDSLKEIMDNITRDAETLLLQQSRVSSELQDGLMQTRMVRFDGLRGRLARIVRQTSSQLGKKAQLSFTGGEIELDRSVQERIVAPLEHVLRNAVAHGIEPAEERERRGKPAEGVIQLDLHRGGTDIVIEVTDDGRGIDPEAVRRRAIERGLIGADDQLDDGETIRLVLETGFTTADSVTQIAGRGVGMDVVDSEIRRLGGTLGINTEVGRGTRFSIRLPVTLAINQAVLVDTGDDVYAIPIASVEGIAQVSAGELKPLYVDRSRSYLYANTEYRLEHLGRLLGTSEPRLDDSDRVFPVIMIRAGDDRIALQVEQLVGRRDIVVKPVGAPVNELAGLSGATIMPDGRVILILDIGGLLRTEGRFVATGTHEEGADASDAVAGLGGAAKPVSEGTTVLVVDDSITIRKVTQRVLERNGYNVATAKDGIDALSWMAHSVPDLMLLDIEMPRMDGYEVATYVRGEQRLAQVPIIMITSRTGDKHRGRAEEIGVNRYLGKPYQEAELMENIEQLLQSEAAV
ncbi:MAG: response regulator, partial [Halofilum sp. (in: g-proteobacteria)]